MVLDIHPLIRTVHLAGPGDRVVESLLSREWLVTNGLGGYASGTLPGVATRRYHGILVAALPAPYGRTIMLNRLTEVVRLADGRRVDLGGAERADDGLQVPGAGHLREFALDMGLPVWRYEVEGALIEKRISMVHGQNTVFISYRLASGDERLRLELRPALHFRGHDAPVSERLAEPYHLSALGDRYEIAAPDAGLPPLRLKLFGERAVFTLDGGASSGFYYRTEASRGYESQGPMWRPGYLRADLCAGWDVTLVASTEEWRTILSLQPLEAYQAERLRRERLIAMADPRARNGTAAELVLAADQFIITPAGRVEESARAHASGDEVRTVIAGYHWFTDWGRDTMISLEGLTLTTGREREAGYILRTFAQYVRDGLIPNLFPEHEHSGLYHTADATLWFFHAVARYVAATSDRVTLRWLLPKLREIVELHVRGTRFGIGVDPSDGLLRQGAEGYQLTWMDAKVEDWVVTPRRGKAVEVNALWYNALRLLSTWLAEEGDENEADRLAEQADRASTSFNQRFWNQSAGYLYDVIDGERGNDAACRPNQVFAIALDHPVLDRARWEPVLNVVREQLLTPAGLRSLAPGHPDYKPRYYGDLRARDAAYHQGTVWAWLIGPYVDAWLKTYPDDRQGARAALAGLLEHLDNAGVGTISEIFDADPPFSPRGCIAQAWSVAEVLRCLVKTAEMDVAS